MKRLEALYVWYGGTMAALLVLCGSSVPGRWLWVLGHLLVVGPAFWLSRQPRIVRYVAACVLTPTAFSTLGCFIEDLVPDPFHWTVAAWDAAAGGEGVRLALAAPPVWLVEICQLCYASFYFLPIALCLVLLARSRFAAATHTIELVIGGFLLSYLCYVMTPTLPPYRFMPYPVELGGGFVFELLNPLLYHAEALRQDCMPSGHLMMTALTVIAAWRYARGQLVWLAPVAAFLVLGTLVLRYHWFVDLVAAVPLVGVALLLFRPASVRRPR